MTLSAPDWLRRRDGAALKWMRELWAIARRRKLQCAACGGLSKTVGTERFNRQENLPSVLRRWRAPYRIFLNARSPWVPQVLATCGF